VVNMKGASMNQVDGRETARGVLAIVVAATIAALLSFAGGCETPSAQTTSRNFGLRGDLPVDPPGSDSEAEDDCAEGGRLWKQYCGSCHNARPLGERPFSNYHVAIAHMRDQAYLTGKEYRQIVAFVRRWHDVGPATPAVDPSPKRFHFSQPVSELRGEAPPVTDAPPPAGPGPWQPPAADAPPAEKSVAEALPAPIP
jgi:mono/diheme cytochrome c family protein